jgi:D-serine deaminase-like pyridoxal phosphate-dependent protein
VTPEDRLGVVIDVDVAMGRTGTRDLDKVLALADAAQCAPGLSFRGIQHYAGQIMHVAGHDERRGRSLALWETVAGFVDALTARGFAPQLVTGGGTGTYDIDVGIPCITDLQVGSYLFMDHQYRVIGGARGAVFDDFELALQVVVTAISQPRQGLVTVDGGYKAFAVDAGAPPPLEARGFEYRFAGDEHGVLVAQGDAVLPRLGERIRFAAPHCDPTVNLYDWYWICRDGEAREIWPIAARGCSW